MPPLHARPKDVSLRTLEHLADRLLPGGAIREAIRSRYERYRNPLYALDRMIRRAEPRADGSLLVELVDGLRLAGPADYTVWRQFRNADPRRLRVLAPFGAWSIFLQMLAEEVVDDIYGLGALHGGATVVDLGAHVGACALVAARRVGPKGRVVAFEPSRANRAFLEANLVANGLANVSIVGKGAWSAPAVLRLRLSSLSIEHSFEERLFGGEDTGQAEDVEVDTVDNVLRALDVGAVDLLKMDVEGAELEVLRGAPGTLARTKRVVVAAYHRLRDGTPTYPRVRSQLRSAGFRVWDRKGIVYASAEAS
jgi:FkbM family methyltransferase